MAEREGFEPSRGCYPSNGLANRRLKPLGHLSVRPVIDLPVWTHQVDRLDEINCPKNFILYRAFRPALSLKGRKPLGHLSVR